MAVANAPGQSRGRISPTIHSVRTIPVLALGMSASLFFVISYVICVIGYLLFPALPIQHAALAIFLPGFELLSWGTFFLGLIESFAYGWYVALIFGPLYNFFALRWR
jgi:uncharacterized membrane protein